ncbi:C1QL [Mytilus coruscus]|uniref:C1QL n=1 Tax=Mytilus coruscus TaxID=42192 RepID=A0A6J8A9S6_MYTCO|nr:C1QL [Mytilus coruscus]
MNIADSVSKRLLLNSPSTNIVAFSAILDHTVILGPLQVVKYNKILTNIGNAYDPHHGHVVVPTNGIYLVSVTGMNDGAKDIHLELVRNDDLIGTLYLGSNGWSSMSQTLVLSLGENDLIWMRVYNANVYAGHRLVGSANQYYNSFSLLLITPLKYMTRTILK